MITVLTNDKNRDFMCSKLDQLNNEGCQTWPIIWVAFCLSLIRVMIHILWFNNSWSNLSILTIIIWLTTTESSDLMDWYYSKRVLLLKTAVILQHTLLSTTQCIRKENMFSFQKGKYFMWTSSRAVWLRIVKMGKISL